MEDCKNILNAVETNVDHTPKLVQRRNFSPRNCSKCDDEPRRKKRRKKNLNKNEKMRNIIIDIEKEIEEVLDTKTEDDDFTTTNVKGILKELIMDEDIKEMVRQTLHPGDSIRCYEPKLTRAKVRKLLELRPDLKIPILWPLPENNTSFVSECLSLINEDYDENSAEDEEYKPDEDEHDFSTSIFQSETDIRDIVSTSSKRFDVDTTSTTVNARNNFAAVEENIGQRTRSKLPLTEKRIEEIEQTFNPPDITLDMYDCDIDNEDYLNFLREFSASYDICHLEPGDNEDDLEDDPEYRIPADAETVDREELRRDESTEVTTAEVWQLINEIIGSEPIKNLADRQKLTETSVTETQSDGNNLMTKLQVNSTILAEIPNPSSLAQTKNSVLLSPSKSLDQDDTRVLIETNVKLQQQENIMPQIPTNMESNEPNLTSSVPEIIESPGQNYVENKPFLTKRQTLLFEQQMRQHVQLTTMHFLQCYKHPNLYQFANEMKNMLVTLQLLSKSNKKSAYFANNLDDALKLIHEWEETTVNIPDPETKSSTKKKCFGKRRKPPAELMKVVCKSCAFLYPLLLPEKLFCGTTKNTVSRRDLTKSEEWLLAVGLQQFLEYVENSMKLEQNQSATLEALKLVAHYLLPLYKPPHLLHILKKYNSEDADDSSIKYYLEHQKAPPLKHFVIPVSPMPLYKQPYDLLPKIWQDYISNNFVVLKRN